MLTLDYANCLADRVGAHGIDPALLDPHGEAATGIAALTRKLAQSRRVPPSEGGGGGGGWEVWRDLPHEPLRSAHVGAVEGLVSRLRGRFDNLVVLGIGGSALGNIALQGALNPATYNLLPPGSGGEGGRPGPRLFVIDNVDPAYFGSVLAFLRADDPALERTLFNVVSKSGETAETAAQFMIVRDLL